MSGWSTSVMDLSQVSWRKSSRSNANGGQCIEVGVWHESAYSGNGPDCVESALADNPQDEAQSRAEAGRLFLVRDSKDPEGPVLALSPCEWDAFLRGIKNDAFAGVA
jgi:hypothetical protein